MTVTDQDKHAAKVLKDKGNNYYLRDEFQQAINSYNQSLEYDTSDAVIIHSNKSVCYLRLKNFEQALNEANRAIQLDPKATKAWYYRAQALEQTSGENGWREAEQSYEKALVVGKEKQNAKKIGAALQKQIHNGLQSLRRKMWQLDQQREAQSREQVAQYVSDIMTRVSSNSSLSSINGITDQETHQLRIMQVESFFEQFAQVKQPREAPDYFCCKITFDLMMDPVMTPSGVSYERSAIEEHLREHSYDPVTRQPCVSSDLRPNLNLKDAIDEWSRNNPFYL